MWVYARVLLELLKRASVTCYRYICVFWWHLRRVQDGGTGLPVLDSRVKTRLRQRSRFYFFHERRVLLSGVCSAYTCGAHHSQVALSTSLVNLLELPACAVHPRQ